MAKPIVLDQEWLDKIALQVNGMEYGSVHITVHDGRIVQIDRTERRRFDNTGSKQQPNPQPGEGQQQQNRQSYSRTAGDMANVKAANG